MPLTPGYGETPVDDDEFASLTPAIRSRVGEQVGKAEIYDVEQAIEADVAASMVVKVAQGDVSIDVLLSDHFVRELHRKLYGDIWSWAGTYRKRELNIGIAPERIAAELRSSLESMLYRFEHTNDWNPRQFGIAVHAETVRVHPFTDGNGRTTRLLADLVFIATQDGEELEQYDWDVDKPRYISLLREYDSHRNPCDLAAFIEVQPFGA